MNANETIAKMTAKGLETMQAIGNHQLSFFDEGVVEHSGIWGGILTDEMGHKSSGVINRLLALGLFNHTPDDSDDIDAGGWWSLTALGAEVANILAGGPVVETPAEPVKDVTVTSKKGSKWTYIYVGGELVAEVRNDQVGTVLDFFTKA